MPDFVGTATAWRMRWLPGAAIVLAGTLAASGVVLWVHYGSEVFFEVIASGFAACF